MRYQYVFRAAPVSWWIGFHRIDWRETSLAAVYVWFLWIGPLEIRRLCTEAEALAAIRLMDGERAKGIEFHHAE